MLQIDKVQQIEGVTVYGDGEEIETFYLLPNQCSYRKTPEGKLAFSFFKYRFPIDRPDGETGGGFILFDVAFTVPQDKLQPIRDVLQRQVNAEANQRNIDPVPDVKFGSITYIDGTCNLIIAGSDGTFVEKIQNSGKPSLYGDNTATFGVELTPEGATFFEQAMQGQGPSVGIEYDLTAKVQLPEIKVRASFNSVAFYSFYQEIDVEWNLWKEDSYRETIRERTINSESMKFEPEWGMLTDEDIKSEIRDWAMRTLEDAVERRMIDAIAPVPEDQRNRPDHIENVTRDITSTKISSFTLNYKEKGSADWPFRPNGSLPNIVTLKDPDGNNYLWNDYARVIDLDDPFFRQLRVNVMVNADFDDLPVHSVEVKLNYHGRPMPNMTVGEPEGEVVLNTPDGLGKFGAFVEDDDWSYTYSYQINYTGESRIYQSGPITTDEGNLTIGVGDVGILDVAVSAGDLNWNDIESALVMFSYEDRGVDRIEDQFQLTKTSPSHRIQEVIFEPMRKNYRYQVKYFMKNGSELLGDELDGRAQNLFIDDVFGAVRDVGIRGVGDFNDRIQNVFLDLRYDDEENDYHQTKSLAINANNAFAQWAFPVISQTGGVVKYSGTVAYKDGTSEDIPETIAETNTILVPKPIEEFLEVMLVTDLVDWTQVRLARVSLAYQDPDNNVSESKDFIFSQANSASATWKVEIKDRQQMEYTYKITYFLQGQPNKEVGPETTTDQTLILDPFQ